MNEEILRNAKVLYDYLNVKEEIKKSDLIMGLGCKDIGISKCCSKLYNDGYANKILFSGNKGKGTEDNEKTEAVNFMNVAMLNNVSSKDIILEEKATNTYENFMYSKIMLEEKSIKHKSIIVVQKPYVKLRCRLIADVIFKEIKVFVTSEDYDFEEFLQIKSNLMSESQVIYELIGEISNIIETARFGLLRKIDIDPNVLKSYEFLISKGYDKYIITQTKIDLALKKWKEENLLEIYK